MTGKILSKTYFSTISTTDNPYMIGLEPNVVLIMPAAQIGDTNRQKNTKSSQSLFITDIPPMLSLWYSWRTSKTQP